MRVNTLGPRRSQRFGICSRADGRGVLADGDIVRVFDSVIMRPGPGAGETHRYRRNFGCTMSRRFTVHGQ
jgi:hypothetical protein